MPIERRRTGVERRGLEMSQETASRAHVVQFYTDDSFLISSLAKYFGAALSRGETAIVIATEVHRTGLTKELRRRGVDLNGITRKGRYIALDAAETLSRFLVNDAIDATRFGYVMGTLLEKAHPAPRRKHKRIVVFGEMVALLWEQGKEETAIELERLWNGLARTHSFALRCAYPIQILRDSGRPDLLLHVCEEHAAVIPAA